MLLERPALPPLAELAQPDLRLAGVRINPRINDQSRTGYAVAIKLVRINDRVEKTVTGLPAGTRIGDALWSPDGRRVAMILSRSGTVDLYVGDIDGGNLKRLTKSPKLVLDKVLQLVSVAIQLSVLVPKKLLKCL